MVSGTSIPDEQLSETAIAHQSIQICTEGVRAAQGLEGSASRDSRSKQPKQTHLRSLSEIGRIHRERVARNRQALLSDVGRRELCVSTAKAMLYTLDVLLIFAGLCIMCLGLYLRFLEDDGAFAPTRALWVVSFSALGLSFVAVGSLFGLQRQRECAVDGRRNYVLALFVALGLVGAVAAVAGGAMALVLERAASTAQQRGPSSSSARSLETMLVSNVIAYATGNANGWRDVQSSLVCCGYASIQSMASDESSLIKDIVAANHCASGVYCSSGACAAPDSEASASESKGGVSVDIGSSACPVSGASWCRDALLEKMEGHFKVIGVVGVSLGATQLLLVLLSLFALVRDVRWLRRRSPELEIPHQHLAPIAGAAALVATHDEGLRVKSERSAAPPLATSSGTSTQGQPSQPKKIVRPPKYHETAAFLAREALPGSRNAAPSTMARAVRGPLGDAARASEAYRMAATMLKAANEAARRARPVSWGYGSTDGALARNSTVRSAVMAPISFFRRDNVRVAAAGDRLSVFLTYEGDVYESGRLFPTQDGCGMWRPRQVAGAVREGEGEREAQESSVPAREHWRGGRRLVSVAAGRLAAYALDEDGRVYSWGTSVFGQLGHGDDPDPSADGASMDGSAQGGDSQRRGSHGEGDGDASGVSAEAGGLDGGVASGESHERERDEDRSAADAWTPAVRVGVDRIPRAVGALQGVRVDALAVGSHFVVATCAAGAVYAWGRNCHGQLGLGHRESTGTPAKVGALAGLAPVHIAAGRSHVVGVFAPREAAAASAASGTDYSLVVAWGSGALGRLGLGWSDSRDAMWPREVSFFRGLAATKAAAGADHSLVLCGGGGAPTFVYAFGGNAFGQLGVAAGAAHAEMPTLVEELAGLAVASVGAGARYSAALTGDGQVYAWGDACARKTSRQDARTTFVPWPVDAPRSEAMGSGCLTQLSVGAHHALALVRSGGAMDRWRQFPLGQPVSALPGGSSASASAEAASSGDRGGELMRHAVCVCERSQSRTTSPCGVFLRCDSCAAAPVCRHCVRRCHGGHAVKPVVALGQSASRRGARADASLASQACACSADSCQYARLPSVVREE